MLNTAVIGSLSKLFKDKPVVQKGGEEVLFFCPNCKHHKRKLNINTNLGYYQCWVCGFKGKSFGSLLKKVKASKEFYDLLCKDRPKIHNIFSVDQTRLELPTEFQPLYTPSKDFAYKHALLYCLNRNITTHDIVRYNIGYCSSGQFANRVVVPSYDADGDLNFYCGRDFCGGGLKYRLCEGSKNIIGFEMYTDFSHELTLVEGVFDAMSVKYNAIPLFGKTLSKKLKLKILENHPPRINVLLDNDALNSSIKICEFLIQNGINTYLILLNGKDPNEIGHNLTWKNIRSGTKIDESVLFKYKMTNNI